MARPGGARWTRSASSAARRSRSTSSSPRSSSRCSPAHAATHATSRRCAYDGVATTATPAQHSAPWQGARCLRGRRRAAAARRDRPRERVRRRHGASACRTRARCSRRSRRGGCASSRPSVRASHDLARTSTRSSAQVPGARGASRTCCAVAQCSAGARKCFPIECVDPRLHRRARRGRSTRHTERWPANRCPPDCARATASTRRCSVPATKAETGHDENITIAHDARGIVGDGAAATLERLTPRRLRAWVRSSPEPRGIIIADTKFEFGRDRDGHDHCSIDEVLTPDSSRFWPADRLRAGALAAELRQAAAARLPRRRAPSGPLEWRRIRRRRFPDSVVARNERALPRRLRSHHRQRRSTSTDARS